MGPQVVVLAAGHGHRMRPYPGPKCLLPVLHDQGTLDVLLEWVSREHPVTVVRDSGDDVLAAHLRSHYPHITLRDNPAAPSTGMLGSLVAGTHGLQPQPLIVLLADTIYEPGFRRLLAQWEAPSTTVPVQPRQRDKPFETRVSIEAGRVIDLGPQLDSAWEMAGCVLWAGADWTIFRDAARKGATSQWQALRAAVLPGGPLTGQVAAPCLARGIVFDIDTPADYSLARARLR